MKPLDVFVTLAAETILLNAEIIELALIGEEDFCIDQGRMILELGSELKATERVDAGLERRDAEQTPLGIGDGLEERALGIGGGFPLRFEAREMGLIGFDIVAGQEDGAPGQACFQCVQRGNGAARFRGRASRETAFARLAARRRERLFI